MKRLWKNAGERASKAQVQWTHAERSQLTWTHDADLATKLWGSAEDLYRTVSFVASTGLKI